MRSAMLAFAIVVGVVAVARAETVRIEVSRDDVSGLENGSGASVGLSLRSDIPLAVRGQELAAAFLWLEVRVEVARGEVGSPEALCLAVAPIGAVDVINKAEALPGTPVRAGVTQRVCFDISAMVRDKMHRGDGSLAVAVLPCEGEDLPGGVAFLNGGPAVGSIEFLCSHAAPERMIRR